MTGNIDGTSVMEELSLPKEKSLRMENRGWKASANMGTPQDVNVLFFRFRKAVVV